MLKTLLILGLCTILILSMANMRVIPRCYEDVSLIGVGEFEEGRWSSYVCGPALDDFGSSD